jgi:hypothetical protein
MDFKFAYKIDEEEDKNPPMTDDINPQYYRTDMVHLIDIIEDYELGFHEGNAIKYIIRHKHKGGLKDLQKAQWYIERMIKIYEENS